MTDWMGAIRSQYSILGGSAKSRQVDLLLPRAAIVWCGCTYVTLMGNPESVSSPQTLPKTFCRCVMRKVQSITLDGVAPFQYPTAGIRSRVETSMLPDSL